MFNAVNNVLNEATCLCFREMPFFTFADVCQIGSFEYFIEWKRIFESIRLFFETDIARFLDHFPFSSTELFFCQKLIKIATYHLSHVHGFFHGSVICWLWSPNQFHCHYIDEQHNFFAHFICYKVKEQNKQTDTFFLLSVC